MTTNSVQIDVAQGIVDSLNTHTFSLPFVATRRAGELSDELSIMEDKVYVDIVPFMVRSAMADRGTMKYTVITSICIRRKFNIGTQDAEGEYPNSQIDPMFVLLQEINDYFVPSQDSGRTGRRLTGVEEAAWMENEKDNEDGIIGPYGKYLREHQLFVGIVRVTYEVCRVPV